MTGGADEPRRASAWPRRVALLGFGVVAAFAFLEGALRLTISEQEIARRTSPESPAKDSRWVDHPFFPFVGRPEVDYEFVVPYAEGKDAHVHVHNNAYGFRSREIPAEKGPSDYFIVALGESTTWGAIAETNAKTWPELLEAKLQARYPDRNVRTFNFGTQNITSAYSLVALSLIGVHIHPDLVVIYHGFNETGPALSKNYRTDSSHFFRDLDLAHQWHGYQMSIPRWMLASYAVTYVTSLMDDSIRGRPLSDYVQKPVGDATDDPEQAYMRNWENLRTIAAVAHGYGANALFSTFQYYDGKDELYRLSNATLRKTFEKYDLPYVDQDALLPDFDRELQFDECHFTALGEDRMAENFFEKIVAESWLEPR